MLNPSLHLSPQVFQKNIVVKSCRDGFGEALVQIGETNKSVVALSADLDESTRLTAFKQSFPDRFFEVGVAEQSLVTVASGLAAYGKIPFTTSYAVFSPGRNWEQIRTTVCLNDLPVKLIGCHAGLNVGPDGATHQALEDLALMRSLPNIVVLSPSDYFQTQAAVAAAAQNGKPTYLRLPRAASPVFTTENTPFAVGQANLLWESKDPKVVLIACGPLVYQALEAAQALAKSKINSLVLDSHTIKPLDQQAIIRAAKLAGAVVTVEDHQVAGGLGSAVAEVLAANFPVPIEFIGVHDSFGESGSPAQLFRKHKLTTPHIISAAKRVIKRKNQ